MWASRLQGTRAESSGLPHPISLVVLNLPVAKIASDSIFESNCPRRAHTHTSCREHKTAEVPSRSPGHTCKPQKGGAGGVALKIT